MKTSIRKFLHHNQNHNHNHNHKHRKIEPLAQLDELAKASEAMQDMRDCYDSLLSAAAAATNSAYEFSESLREMGVCLLQKIALNDDEESGKAMLMLGKVQFELQKQVDGYRSHIFQTITVPSESLINQLQTVEDMKHQCDDKRELYEYMKANYRDKGRSRSGKGESFSLQQLQAAKDEFDEEATLFVFRLKSLKQGQSRSLLTQAARHHAAQLSFFRKAVKSLEAVEPHVKLVTRQQHIDYQFSGLEDEVSEDGEDDDANDDGDTADDSDASTQSSVEDDRELTFGYPQNAQQSSNISSVKSTTQVNTSSYQNPFTGDRKMLSQSAPLISQRQFDPAERIRQLRPSSSKKFHTYVLPRPSENPVSRTKSSLQQSPNMFHSHPLEPKNYENSHGTENLSGPIILNSKSVLKERNNNRMPPPLTERVSSQQLNQHISSGSKKPKLQSFSGPMTSMPLYTKPSLSAGYAATAKEAPRFSSGPILRGSTYRSSSPQKSPSASPTFTATPRINELHELPRPPVSLIYNSARPSGFLGFSAPLVSRSPENSAINKSPAPKKASVLPAPPVVPSSFSMPLSSPGGANSSPPRPLRASHNSEKLEDIVSPPLSPIMLTNLHPS